MERRRVFAKQGSLARSPESVSHHYPLPTPKPVSPQSRNFFLTAGPRPQVLEYGHADGVGAGPESFSKSTISETILFPPRQTLNPLHKYVPPRRTSQDRRRSTSGREARNGNNHIRGIFFLFIRGISPTSAFPRLSLSGVLSISPRPKISAPHLQRVQRCGRAVRDVLQRDVLQPEDRVDVQGLAGMMSSEKMLPKRRHVYLRREGDVVAGLDHVQGRHFRKRGSLVQRPDGGELLTAPVFTDMLRSSLADLGGCYVREKSSPNRNDIAIPPPLPTKNPCHCSPTAGSIPATLVHTDQFPLYCRIQPRHTRPYFPGPPLLPPDPAPPRRPC